MCWIPRPGIRARSISLRIAASMRRSTERLIEPDCRCRVAAGVSAARPHTHARDDDRAPRLLPARVRIALTERASARPRRGRSHLVRCESVLGRGGDARSSRRSCEKLTSVIHLVRAELHLMEAALGGDDALARALGHDVVADWATFTEALQPIRAHTRAEQVRRS